MSQKKLFKGHNALLFWESDNSIRDLSDNTIGVDNPKLPQDGEELRADFEKVGEKLIDSGYKPKIELYGRKKAFSSGQLLFFIEQHRQFFPKGVIKMECEGDILMVKIKKRFLKEWCKNSSWRLRALSMLMTKGSIQLL